MESDKTGLLALGPSVAAAALSKFTCSLCLTAYASLLGSLGFGFAATDRGLTLLTAGLLILSLAALAWSSRRHRHPGPLTMAVLGAAVILAGRLLGPTAEAVYAGAGLLMLGSIWNLWLGRRPALVSMAPTNHTAR